MTTEPTPSPKARADRADVRRSCRAHLGAADQAYRAHRGNELDNLDAAIRRRTTGRCWEMPGAFQVFAREGVQVVVGPDRLRVRSPDSPYHPVARDVVAPAVPRALARIASVSGVSISLEDLRGCGPGTRIGCGYGFTGAGRGRLPAVRASPGSSRPLTPDRPARGDRPATRAG